MVPEYIFLFVIYVRYDLYKASLSGWSDQEIYLRGLGKFMAMSAKSTAGLKRTPNLSLNL
jgi:hypothetical protein